MEEQKREWWEQMRQNGRSADDIDVYTCNLSSDAGTIGSVCSYRICFVINGSGNVCESVRASMRVTMYV